jgi:molybdopterin-binding protein
MKLSARNVIEGTITHIVTGPVSTEVTLRVAPRIDIVSVISSRSARALKLRKGGKASAVIKASSVMLGVD